MSTLSIILIAAIIVLAAVAAWLLIARKRSTHLRSRFGPEYQRTVSEFGSRTKAERDLERREKRVERLVIRPLPAVTRERFLQAWRQDQARFVDDPKGAVQEADRLVAEVMKERGYPVADFDQRVDDVSVDHPAVVQNYRAARDLVVRHNRGEATTEDMRRALVHYRVLFEELLAEEEVVR